MPSDPKRHCWYDGLRAKMPEGFPPCREGPAYRIANYWGPTLWARKVGPHLYLCGAHARWWVSELPFSPKPKRLTNRRITLREESARDQR